GGHRARGLSPRRDGQIDRDERFADECRANDFRPRRLRNAGSGRDELRLAASPPSPPRAREPGSAEQLGPDARAVPPNRPTPNKPKSRCALSTILKEGRAGSTESAGPESRGGGSAASWESGEPSPRAMGEADVVLMVSSRWKHAPCYPPCQSSSA